MKFFNTAGPVNLEDHYALPPLSRLDADEALPVIILRGWLGNYWEVEWPLDTKQGYYGKVHRIVIELKILRGNLDTLIEQGMEQVAEYADAFNADETHLILFNRDPTIAWAAKIWQQSRSYGSRQIEIWGC